MISKEYFQSLVLQEYKFLEDSYDFKYLCTVDTHRSIFIYYTKKPFIIGIEYSRANDYINITIYNNINANIDNLPYFRKDSIMLWSLLWHLDKNFDYVSIMPSQISVEDSVKQTAKLFREYFHLILLGKEWITLD